MVGSTECFHLAVEFNSAAGSYYEMVSVVSELIGAVVGDISPYLYV